MEEIEDFLGDVPRLLFVPFALADCDGYAKTVRRALASRGVSVDSLHASGDPVRAVEEASAVFIGGGNTFRLLKALYDRGVVVPLRRRVLAGALAYMGSSAGTNVATLSIRTTNDMPIVEPPTFEALGLVPFNINPHYLDPLPGSTHMGETREQRIREFHEENEPPVVGLREGAWLRVTGEEIRLGGGTGARIFRRGKEPFEAEPGALLRLG